MPENIHTTLLTAIIAQGTVTVLYTADDGSQTARAIQPQSIERLTNEGGLVVSGLCGTDLRSIRLNRITEVVAGHCQATLIEEDEIEECDFAGYLEELSTISECAGALRESKIPENATVILHYLDAEVDEVEFSAPVEWQKVVAMMGELREGYGAIRVEVAEFSYALNVSQGRYIVRDQFRNPVREFSDEIDAQRYCDGDH